MYCWVNGQTNNTISVSNRGLAYGDGLFETFLVRFNKPLLLNNHLERLSKSCARLGLFADLQLIQQELESFCLQINHGVVKLILAREAGSGSGSGSGRGYAISSSSTVCRILQQTELPKYSKQNQFGIHLFSCQTRLSMQPKLAGMKHLNRLEQILARAEWSDPYYAEGLMRDLSGYVIEGVFSNIFIIKDGCISTPLLVDCGVDGVMRAELLDQIEALGLCCCVERIELNRFLLADEVFVCNSLYGVWPVLGFENTRWSKGPITRKLQTIANQLLSY